MAVLRAVSREGNCRYRAGILVNQVLNFTENTYNPRNGISLLRVTGVFLRDTHFQPSVKEQEFSCSGWVQPEWLVEQIPSFKKDIYRTVVSAFRPLFP
jgi:hypothetical protein